MKRLITALIPSLIFANIDIHNDISFLEKVSQFQVSQNYPKKPQQIEKMGRKRLKIVRPKKRYKYEIYGYATINDVLGIFQNLGYSIIYDSDALEEDIPNKRLFWNIRTNDINEILKAIQTQANVWVIQNPLTKTIEVKKYRWLTIEPDLEGTTAFSLSAGNGGGIGGNSNSNSGSSSANNQSGANTETGTTASSGGVSGTGFQYSIRNQDVKLFLSVLSSLNIPAYPFSAGFVKLKVSPSQYEAVKTIMNELKKHSEVIIGKVEILKVDLNNRNRWGINWSAFFKGFRVGQIKEASLSLNLTPFSTSENPVQVALLDKNGNTDALIQFLKQYGNVKAVNTWIFEGKTGTIIPFGSYKEEPYLTYQVVQGETATQVVPQVEYKYAGFMGNIYVAKQKNRYFVELALSLSDIYGYFTLTTQQFTEQIPKLQANEMKISTYIPHLNTTLLLTGFKLKSIQNTEEKVPFLGDIPLIGNLFKSSDKQVVNSEFVILVSLYKFTKNMEIKSSPEKIEKSIRTYKKEVQQIDDYGKEKKKKIIPPYEVIYSF